LLGWIQKNVAYSETQTSLACPMKACKKDFKRTRSRSKQFEKK
jgi:hypothetical protein